MIFGREDTRKWREVIYRELWEKIHYEKNIPEKHQQARKMYAIKKRETVLAAKAEELSPSTISTWKEKIINLKTLLMYLFLYIFLISWVLPQWKINSGKTRYKCLLCAWVSNSFNEIKSWTRKSDSTSPTYRAIEKKAFKNQDHLHWHFPN